MNIRNIFLAFTILISATVMVSNAQNITQEQAMLLEQYKKNGAQQTDAINSIERNKVKNVENRQWEEVIVPSQKGSERIIASNKDNSVFGREIFDKNNVTFAPNYNIPTPANYILGAGDQIFLEIWGSTQKTYDLKISPDGNINIPNVGPVHLSGLTVEKAQQIINEKLSNINEGMEEGNVSARISLGNIRSIQVAVIGEAAAPGTYTVPSLASLFNVIYAAGGVSNIGSVRDIKLYRNGKLITTLDVYDYLLHGKNIADIRMENGDMIVVSPFSSFVSVKGNVKRPKTFEIKPGETISDLITFSGGFNGDAYTENITVNRPNGKQMEIITLPKKDFSHFALKNKDSIIIGQVSNKFANRVQINGAVWRPGYYAISEEIATIKDLIKSAEGLRERAYLDRVLLSRLNEGSMVREIISINVGDILSGKTNDIKLQNDDILTINSVDDLRQDRTISVLGEVNSQKINIPFMENLSIADAIILASGLKESASLARLEVVRRIKDPHSTTPTTRKAEVFSFTIPEDLSLESEASKFKLQPFDEIYVRRSPGYSVQEDVTVVGQVVFPGQYAINSTKDRISDLVKAAGGLSPEAYINGANLKRRMSAADRERVIAITKIMRSDLNNKRDSMTMDLDQLTSTYSVGINLQAAIDNPGSDADIVLKEGDILTVPEYNNVVKINGAVYFPNAVTYNPSMKLNDYVDMAGGYTKMARRKAFIIYMNGMIAVNGNGKQAKIEPGCEIIVPSKPPKIPVSLAEVIGITSSSVSMLALIANLFK